MLWLFASQCPLAIAQPANVREEADKPGSLDHLVFDTRLIPAERGLPGPSVLWLSLEGKHVAVFETDEPPRNVMEKAKHRNVYAFAEGDAAPSLVYKNAEIVCFLPPGLLVLNPSRGEQKHAILFKREAPGWKFLGTRAYTSLFDEDCARRSAQIPRGRRSANVELTASPHPQGGYPVLLVKEADEEYFLEDYKPVVLTVRQTREPSKHVVSELTEAASILDTAKNSLEALPSPVGKVALPLDANFYSFPAPDFKALYIAPGFWGRPFGIYRWDGVSSRAEKLVKLKRQYTSGAWVSVSPDQCFAAFSSIRRDFFPPPPTVNFVNLCAK